MIAMAHKRKKRRKKGNEWMASSFVAYLKCLLRCKNISMGQGLCPKEEWLPMVIGIYLELWRFLQTYLRCLIWGLESEFIPRFFEFQPNYTLKPFEFWYQDINSG